MGGRVFVDARWSPRVSKGLQGFVLDIDKDWVDRFQTGFGVDTVGELCDLLNYNEPVELLTMFLCFAGCPQVRAVGHKWLRQHAQHLKVAMAAYAAAWHCRPIPACIIPIVSAALGE